MNTAARLRDRDVLEQQIVALGRDLNRAGGPSPAAFRRGAMDALRWVTRGGPAPLTGCQDGPGVSVQAIVRELAAAEAVIYGHPSRQRAYCTGAEHALMWAQFATAAPPLRQMLDDRSMWPAPSRTAPYSVQQEN